MRSSATPRVIVIGSGLAGLTCALDSARRGARVEVVTAARAGRDGSTHRVHGLAPWILLTAPWVSGDGPSRYLADLDRRGEGIGRPGLAEVLAEESRSAAEELSRNLNLERVDDAPLALPWDTMPRGMRWRPHSHRPLLEPLVHACLAAGISVEESTLVVGLLTASGRAAGVLCVRGEDGGLREAPADAVVLACGGATAVFPVGTAPQFCTGLGLAWGCAKAVLLHRPELIQCLPVCAEPPHSFLGTTVLMQARTLVDGQPIAAQSSLEQLTQVIGEAERSGRHVALDLAALDLPIDVQRILPHGKTGTIPVTVAAHHSVGGVAIDVRGRTSVPGLYACGEAAGGIQGRSRTMGTGLLEAHVFGRRAARTVIADFRRLGPSPAPDGVVLPRAPARSDDLERELDRRLGAVMVPGAHEEARATLDWLRSWLPAGGSQAPNRRAFQAGLRWAAACAILEGVTGATPH